MHYFCFDILRLMVREVSVLFYKDAMELFLRTLNQSFVDIVRLRTKFNNIRLFKNNLGNWEKVFHDFIFIKMCMVSRGLVFFKKYCYAVQKLITYSLSEITKTNLKQNWPEVPFSNYDSVSSNFSCINNFYYWLIMLQLYRRHKKCNWIRLCW